MHIFRTSTRLNEVFKSYNSIKRARLEYDELLLLSNIFDMKILHFSNSLDTKKMKEFLLIVKVNVGYIDSRLSENSYYILRLLITHLISLIMVVIDQTFHI